MGSFLKKFGVEPLRPVVDRTLDEETRKSFFYTTFCEITGSSPQLVEYTSEQKLSFDEYNFCKLAENFYWSPLRPHAEGQGEKLAALAGSLISQPLEIKVPDSLRYRIYTDKNGSYVVHFMPVGVTANYHPTVRLHKIGNPIVQSLDYEPLQGKVEITGKITGARLYSADLDEVRACKVTNGTAEVELEGLRRFFSVKLEK